MHLLMDSGIILGQRENFDQHFDINQIISMCFTIIRDESNWKGVLLPYLRVEEVVKPGSKYSGVWPGVVLVQGANSRLAKPKAPKICFLAKN